MKKLRHCDAAMFGYTWNIGVGGAVEKQLNHLGAAVLGGHLDCGAAELVPAVAMWHVVQLVAGVQQQPRDLHVFRVHFLHTCTRGTATCTDYVRH